VLLLLLVDATLSTPSTVTASTSLSLVDALPAAKLCSFCPMSTNSRTCGWLAGTTSLKPVKRGVMATRTSALSLASSAVCQCQLSMRTVNLTMAGTACNVICCCWPPPPSAMPRSIVV
jgi:hypothetical protein